MTEPDSRSSEPVSEKLDVRGQRCPMPLLRAKQVLKRMSPGQTLEVWATDAGSVRDFAAYAQLGGHQLVRQRESEGVFIHVLRKGDSTP